MCGVTSTRAHDRVASTCHTRVLCCEPVRELDKLQAQADAAKKASLAEGFATSRPVDSTALVPVTARSPPSTPVTSVVARGGGVVVGRRVPTVDTALIFAVLVCCLSLAGPQQQQQQPQKKVVGEAQREKKASKLQVRGTVGAEDS